MAYSPDNQAFAERLRQALKRSPKKIATPSELALQFNLHHEGNQISNQSAQKWLSGENKPTPDKIATLARMLRVPAQWLRYGIAEPVRGSKRRELREPPSEESLSAREQQLLSQLRILPEHQQTLVMDLVEQFALQQAMWHE